ncbi:MAG: hypothetical protein HKM02_06300 [Pseudomonadales bacterium]|nr:hypothetical protein [Pseudomonadales bacterium]
MSTLSIGGSGINIAGAGTASGLPAPAPIPDPVPQATPAATVSLVSQAPQTQAPSSSTSPAQVAAVQQAVKQLNNYLQSANFELNFSQDAQGTHFVQIVDTKTHQVVRQIPDKVAVALAEDINLQVMARAAGKSK